MFKPSILTKIEAAHGLTRRVIAGRQPDGSPARAHAAGLDYLVDALARWGSSDAGGDPGKSIAGRLAEIRKQMSKADSEYWRSDAMQQEYRDLLAHQGSTQEGENDIMEKTHGL